MILRFGHLRSLGKFDWVCSNSGAVLQTEVAIASEVSNSSKNSLASRDLPAKKPQLANDCAKASSWNPPLAQRRRNDNINKICVLEGVGEGDNLRKIVQNAVFPGKFHDNKIWKFCEFYCQKFCCHLGGSYLRLPNREPMPRTENAWKLAERPGRLERVADEVLHLYTEAMKAEDQTLRGHRERDSLWVPWSSFPGFLGRKRTDPPPKKKKKKARSASLQGSDAQNEPQAPKTPKVLKLKIVKSRFWALPLKSWNRLKIGQQYRKSCILEANFWTYFGRIPQNLFSAFELLKYHCTQNDYRI